MIFYSFSPGFTTEHHRRILDGLTAQNAATQRAETAAQGYATP